MRNRLLLGIGLLISLNSFASEARINGDIKLNNAQYDSLEVNGNFVFEDLEVQDELKINGRKKGKNLKCGKIKSNGLFKVDGLVVKDIKNNGSFIGKNVEISGVGKFTGSVEITNGKLNEIEISSEKVVFTNSKINRLLVKEINSDWNEKKKQVVQLHGDSLVNDMDFEKAGEVHIFDKSQVTGKVSNCEIIKK